jgi:hypothetical protein
MIYAGVDDCGNPSAVAPQMTVCHSGNRMLPGGVLKPS